MILTSSTVVSCQALGTDAQLVDLLEQLQAQFLDVRFCGPRALVRGCRSGPWDLLRHHRCFLRGTADTDAEHARRAPAGAHGRYGLPST